MPTIRSERFAGSEVWLGDGLVAFDDAGYAIGVVKRPGPGLRISPPDALGDSQFASAKASPSYEVGSGDRPAPPVEAEVPAEVDEEVPPVEGGETEDEALPDFAAMTRAELYVYCRDVLGLEIEYKHTPKEKLIEYAQGAAEPEAPGDGD